MGDVDEHPKGVLNQGTGVTLSNLGVMSYSQPQMVPTIQAEMGLHVSQGIKNKIIEAQYVDLASLLQHPGQSEAEVKRNLSISQTGELIVSQSNVKQIYPIEEWSDAFLIFASLYLIAHPNQTQEVLKYFDIIGTAGKRHLGSG